LPVDTAYRRVAAIVIAKYQACWIPGQPKLCALTLLTFAVLEQLVHNEAGRSK